MPTSILGVSNVPKTLTCGTGWLHAGHFSKNRDNEAKCENKEAFSMYLSALLHQLWDANPSLSRNRQFISGVQ